MRLLSRQSNQTWEDARTKKYLGFVLKSLNDATWQGNEYELLADGQYGINSKREYTISPGNSKDVPQEFYALHASYLEIDKIIITCFGIRGYDAWLHGDHTGMNSLVNSSQIANLLNCQTSLVVQTVKKYFVETENPIILLTTVGKGIDAQYDSSTHYLRELTKELIGAGYKVWIGNHKKLLRNEASFADFFIALKSAFFISSTEGSTFDHNVLALRPLNRFARVQNECSREVKECQNMSMSTLEILTS